MSNKNISLTKEILILTIIVFSVICLSCKKQVQKLRIGGHTSIYGTVLEIGDKMGLFKKNGLDVSLMPVRSSKESMAALVGGTLDLALGTAAAGNLNLLAKSDLCIIADAGSIIPQLLIRKELKEKGQINSISDLKGRTVSVPREGSASWYAMDRILSSVNLKIEDLIPKYLGQRETITSFEAKHIDAGILAEPYTTIAIEKGIVVLFRRQEISNLFPENGQQYSVIYTTYKMIEEEITLKKFLKAYLESIEIYEKARQETQPEYGQVLEIVNQFTNVPIEILKKIEWPKLRLDGKPNVEYLIEMQNTFIEKGLIPYPVDFSKVVRMEFLN